MTAHRLLREELGAYALGALEPRERAEVDAHLRECPACREELARLASLPGLLARLSADEAAEPAPAAPFDGGDRALAALAARRRAHRRRGQRRGAAVVAAAAAAVVALALLVVPGNAGDGDGVPLRIQPVAADAGSVTGTGWAEGRAWGTAIGVDLRRLPERPAYELTAIARDGHREVAATWAATESGAIELEGACAIRPVDMAGYEVTTRDGEVLLRLHAGAWE